MPYYFSVLAFGLFYLVAMGGWGTLFAKILAIGHRGFGLCACWGLAVSVVIGGILNALHVVSRSVLLTYLVIGFFSAVICRFGRRYRRDDTMSKGNLLGVMLIFAVVAARYANAAAYTDYQQRDDHGAYFVFPLKLLETGTLGQDPFSERRLTNSIGGGYFLQAILLTGVKPQNLNLLDHGIALLLITALVFDMMRDRGATWSETLLLLSVVALSVLPRINITSSMLSCCMYFALYRSCLIARDSGLGVVRGSIPIALTFAGTISLKSTMLPPAALYLLLFFCSWLWFSREKIAVIRTIAITAVCALIFLILWMVDMRRSGGTFWFPILGKGFHVSAYGPFPMPTDDVRLSTLPAVLRLVFILLIAYVPLFYLAVLIRRRNFRSDLIVLCLAVLIGACLLSIATGGLVIQRFTAPFLFAAAIICLAETIKIAQVNQLKHRLPWQIASMPLLPVLCAGLIIGDSFQSLRLDLAPGIASIRSFARGQIGFDSRKQNQYLAAESTVPPGKTILTALDDPYYLDFRRNRVLIADIPTVSPPPGMPLSKGPEAVAAYLLKLNIRYVAYSYATQAGYPFDDFQGDLRPDANPWMRGQVTAIFDLHNSFQALARTRRKMFDDGDIFVLDLASQP